MDLTFMSVTLPCIAPPSRSYGCWISRDRGSKLARATRAGNTAQESTAAATSAQRTLSLSRDPSAAPRFHPQVGAYPFGWCPGAGSDLIVWTNRTAGSAEQMAGNPMLRQWSNERASLLARVFPRVGAVALGRRRVVSGIRWRGDLMVTAAEAVADAERLHRFCAWARRSRSSAVICRVLAIWGSVRLAGPGWRSRRGGEIAQRLELDARFDPGLEGAAVIDMQGAVVAMAVPGALRRVIGIPAQTVEQIVSAVERHGRLPKPYIGLRLQSLWLDEPTRAHLGRTARRIAVVGGVDAGSPAAQAQMELGDLLLGVDGRPLEGADSLAQRIADVRPGQVVALEVLRGGKPVVVNVEVGERPRA
ncbi:MAG: serine protease [Gammaproteobacteria bacterium]|nr:MAG: serine protease [Gammaproteobacteria bacterium]